MDSKDLQQITESVERLRRSSRPSLVLVGLATAFVIAGGAYSFFRVKPLEIQVRESKGNLATLKNNAESLYSVRVTPENEVYEVKSSAIATGKVLPTMGPEYAFSLFINAPSGTLKTIKDVQYYLDHPTFKQKMYASTDASNGFLVSYRGWGCLTNVKVTVDYADGRRDTLDYNMCKNLGPQWMSNNQ